MNLKTIFVGIAVVFILGVVLSIWSFFWLSKYAYNQNQRTLISSFEDCVGASYPVMESYPEKCKTPDGRNFVKNTSLEPIGNQVEKPTLSSCYVAGCSGEVCSDQKDAASSCLYKEEYACYKTVKCERQASGQCGWTMTMELKNCLELHD